MTFVPRCKKKCICLQSCKYSNIGGLGSKKIYIGGIHMTSEHLLRAAVAILKSYGEQSGIANATEASVPKHSRARQVAPKLYLFLVCR